jgi:hypothetical protein
MLAYVLYRFEMFTKEKRTDDSITGGRDHVYCFKSFTCLQIKRERKERIFTSFARLPLKK